MGEKLHEYHSRHLPRTSRVNEEILNYYLQYGRERDLEKFMRLYSPVSSKSSSRCTSTSSSENFTVFQRLFNLNESTNVKTDLKNRNIKQQDENKENMKYENAEKNIPIMLRNKIKQHAVSCEDLQTPEKSKQTEIEARTPESIAKSARRLEWDSLGDVGYKKSMSTSNISILERSLLKELFQNAMITNASETDLKKWQMNVQTDSTENPLPLASSTLTDSKNVHKKKGGNLKHISQSSNTTQSLRKIHDKSSQTSLKYPRTNTLESLVSFSSENCASSSVICGTVTPSSFEYYSSKSSIKSVSTAKESNSCETVLHHHDRNICKEQALKEFTSNVNNILSNKPQTGFKGKEDSACGLKTCSLTNVLAENYQQKQQNEIQKNNQIPTSTSSINSQSLQLDLEVQLICALIEAKSLTLSEKKQLIHDIVTQISRIGITTTEYDKTKKNVRSMSSEETNHLSDNVAIKLALQDTANGTKSQNYKSDSFIKEKPKIDSVECDSIQKDKNSNTDNKIETDILDKNNISKEKSLTISTSSQEQITQKTNKACDEENISMGEWLNPITQSEIQYENKGEISYENEVLLEDERNEQINWIEAEIKRLESLRFLLATDTTKSKNSPTDRGNKHFSTTGESKTKRIYNRKETNGFSSSHEWYSIVGNGSIPHNSTEETPKSNEKTKKTAKDIAIAGMTTIVDETDNKKQSTSTHIQTNSLKKLKTLPRQQRSKIDTPSDSNESVSVCSFVRQRKSDFIEQYRSKKMFFQEQRKLRQYSKRERNHTACSYGMSENISINNHYSLPNTIKHSQNRIKFSKQHSPPKSTLNEPKIIESVSLHNANEQNKMSSSTLVCSSSEMSVPMGSYISSSSLTASHKYDDVAGTGMMGVGVQTSDSMLRTQPIFCQNHNSSHERVIHSSIFVPASVQVKPKSIAYVITFDEKSVTEDHVKTKSTSSSSFAEQSSPLTLQDYLERARPEFCASSNERKEILNEIQILRQARGEEIQKLVENLSITTLDKKINRLPPPPTSYLRIFPTNEMKSITNKRFSKLPEVLEKKERIKEERRRRNNRLLRDLFNKRLQKRVRSGKLSLNHSKTII